MHEQMSTRTPDHRQLLTAFREISDKEALAWSILDTKSEAAVTRALAVSANRQASARVAHVEYPPRLDLVFVQDGKPFAAYEAKAAYTTDFQERRIAKDDWYLGQCTDDDLVKLNGLPLKHPTIEQVAGIFFIYEVSDSSKQLKYGGNPPVPAETAIDAACKGVKLGTLNQVECIDCGTVDGARVKIHMCVFDPRPAAAAEV